MAMPWPEPRMTVEEAAVTVSDGTAMTSLAPVPTVAEFDVSFSLI